MQEVIPTRTLRDGLDIPVIGFGTGGLKGMDGAQVITSAIHNGYRLLDTAYNYENEGTVGSAIKQSHISRTELLITSKLPGRFHEYDKAVHAIQESLFRADLDYFDLYLIHWPNPKQDQFVEAWQALVDAKKWGLIRSIGVSNFLPEHIERLEKETGVLPSINQIELHPFFHQTDQRQWHEEHDIATEAWSPLYRAQEITNNSTLQQIAQKYQKSVGQVILRWHYQSGTITIPKSTSPQRQLDNRSIFDFALDYEDMENIAELASDNGRINDQDPAVYEEF